MQAARSSRHPRRTQDADAADGEAAAEAIREIKLRRNTAGMGVEAGDIQSRME